MHNISSFAALMIVFVVVIGIMLVAFWLYANRARQFNLTDNVDSEGRPEWLDTSPPPEVVAATKAAGEEHAMYSLSPDEKVAAPFAEQIEDIAQALMAEDPEMRNVKLDFGSATGGELEFWVNGKRFESIDQIPDEKIRSIIQRAIERYNQYYSPA